jgi:hypothetical protein
MTCGQCRTEVRDNTITQPLGSSSQCWCLPWAGICRERRSSLARGEADMKIKIWPDDTTVPEMDEWLAELRDGPDGPSGAGRAEPSGAPSAAPVAPPRPPAEPAALPVHAALPMLGAPPRPPAEVAVPAEPPEPAVADAPAPATMRAVIGDQLRIPISWCEMGSCISWHADPEALGEGDERARAIEAGWRFDAFGRLACPRCQQADPGFWATHPVVPWDRYTAMARAARFAAGGAARASGY